MSDKFMAADIDNILKERSKEVIFTDNGYEDAEDIFSSNSKTEEGSGGQGKNKIMNGIRKIIEFF